MRQKFEAKLWTSRLRHSSTNVSFVGGTQDPYLSQLAACLFKTSWSLHGCCLGAYLGTGNSYGGKRFWPRKFLSRCLLPVSTWTPSNCSLFSSLTQRDCTGSPTVGCSVHTSSSLPVSKTTRAKSFCWISCHCPLLSQFFIRPQTATVLYLNFLTASP